jgi:hypothetical protein
MIGLSERRIVDCKLDGTLGPVLLCMVNSRSILKRQIRSVIRKILSSDDLTTSYCNAPMKSHHTGVLISP